AAYAARVDAETAEVGAELGARGEEVVERDAAREEVEHVRVALTVVDLDRDRLQAAAEAVQPPREGVDGQAVLADREHVAALDPEPAVDVGEQHLEDVAT